MCATKYLQETRNDKSNIRWIKMETLNSSLYLNSLCSMALRLATRIRRDDVEKRCEDAVFELCDARERYPLRCTNELQKTIKLQNEINMMRLFQKPKAMDKSLFLEQNMPSNSNGSIKDVQFEQLDCKLYNAMNKLNNLKAVMEQIEREKTCEMNILLKS